MEKELSAQRISDFSFYFPYFIMQKKEASIHESRHHSLNDLSSDVVGIPPRGQLIPSVMER